MALTKVTTPVIKDGAVTSAKLDTNIAIDGNLTVDTNTLYVDSADNRVGIGTIDPTAILDVRDTDALMRVAVTNASGEATLELRGLGSGGTGNAISRLVSTPEGTDTASALRFETRNSSGTIAEKMRIDSSGNVGIGTTSPARIIHAKDSVPAIRLEDSDVSGLYHEIIGTAAGEVQFKVDAGNVQANSDLVFVLDGSEKMRIDSGGDISFRDTSNNEAFYWDASTARLGIGTASTSSNAVLTINETDGKGIEFQKNANFKGRISTDGTGSGLVYNVPSGSNQMFFVGGNEKARINYQGNVGIGTTSPAFDFEVNKDNGAGSATYISLRSNDTGVGVLLFGNQSDAATASISYYSATQHLQFNGYNNAERMRIDSSGNVGIGTTSPAVKLHTYDSGNNTARIEGGSTNIVSLEVKDATNSLSLIKYTNSHNEIRSTGNIPLLFKTNGNNERMRITSGGELLVNTTNNYGNIVGIDQAANYDGTSDSAGIRIFSSGGTDNNGDYHGAIQFSKGTGSAAISAVQDASDSDVLGLAFFTHPSSTGTAASEEKMRITSGGDLRFNTTVEDPIASQEDGFTIGSGGDGRTKIFHNNATSLLLGRGTEAAVASFYYNATGTATAVGSISITSSSTAYNTSSDYRLKENVVPMEGALDRVDALKPSRFNFIADADKTVDGFLAHEVAEVVPEAISGEKDAVDEEGNAIYQGIDQSKLVPLLVGAIQELRAEIETLKSQINN